MMCGIKHGNLLLGNTSYRRVSGNLGYRDSGKVKFVVNVFWQCGSCRDGSNGKMWYHSVRLEKELELGICDCSSSSTASVCGLVRCGVHGDNALGLAHRIGESTNVPDSGVARGVARKVVGNSGNSTMVVEGIIACPKHGSHFVSTNFVLGAMDTRCNCKGNIKDLTLIRMSAHKLDNCMSATCYTCAKPFIGGELVGTEVWEKANMSSRSSGSVHWGN